MKNNVTSYMSHLFTKPTVCLIHLWSHKLSNPVLSYIHRQLRNLFQSVYLNTWLFVWTHGYSFEHMAIRLNTWLFVWTHGYSFEHMVIRLNTWLFVWTHGYSFEHMVIRLNTWLFVWTHGYSFEHMVIRSMHPFCRSR